MKINKCERPARESIPAIAAFIARLIVQRDQAVAPHLGVTEQEVVGHLKAFSDIPVERGFFVARHEDRVIGVLGMEAELNKHLIHLVGPFVEGDDWQETADCLWNNLITIIPPSIRTLKAACDEKNQRCIHYLKQNGFAKYNAEATLRLNRKNWVAPLNNKSSIIIEEYSSDFEEQFRGLHSHGVYYTATEILQFLSDHKKLFVAKENQAIRGYLYVEVNPEFGDTDICFIAVAENYRRMGVGTLLLSRALDWSFDIPAIINANVSVRVTNDPSMGLMKKFGFEEIRVIEAYVKSMNSPGYNVWQTIYELILIFRNRY